MLGLALLWFLNEMACERKFFSGEDERSLLVSPAPSILCWVYLWCYRTIVHNTAASQEGVTDSLLKFYWNFTEIGSASSIRSCILFLNCCLVLPSGCQRGNAGNFDTWCKLHAVVQLWKAVCYSLWPPRQSFKNKPLRTGAETCKAFLALQLSWRH